MKRRSISSRLFYAYSILILMIILTVVVTTSMVFSNYLIDNSRSNIEKRLSDIEQALQEEIHGVVGLCDEVKREADVRRLLDSYNRDEGWTKSYNNLLNIHNGITETNYVISRLILVNRDLVILDPVYERVLYREAILNSEGFLDFLTGNYSYHFSGAGIFPVDSAKPPGAEDLTIVLHQKLLDENYWLMGYLLAVLRKDRLFGDLWANNRDGLFEGITVFNSSDEAVHREGLEFSSADIGVSFAGIDGDRWFNTEMTGLKGRPEPFLVFIKPVSGVNWFLAGAVPYSVILDERKFIIRYIAVIGAVFIIIAFTVSYFLAGTITRPLFSITEAMHAYDESLVLEPISVAADGELAYLVNVYNRLVSSINRYIENIYEEQEKKKEAELTSLQYELDFLQAQINPHFIHNTLNAIGHQAEKAGNTEIYESLKSFNILLRASISGTSEMIELGEEIELVMNFVNILELRYGTVFSLDVDIDEELYSVEVPKLILQPIVENSIFHGIEPTGREGRIRITAVRAGGCLELTVADDGRGMSGEELAGVLRGETESRQFNRIGIKNVEDRIKILFGEDFGIEIESGENRGTSVMIRIPEEADA